MSTPKPESEISTLKHKIRHLESENLDLKAQLDKTNRLLDIFKKGKSPPTKIKYKPPFSPDRNL